MYWKKVYIKHYSECIPNVFLSKSNTNVTYVNNKATRFNAYLNYTIA